MRRKFLRNKEHADDGARRRDSENDAKRPDHPFAVPGYAVLTDVPKPEGEENKEQEGEERCCSGLVRAPNCHGETHHEGRHADDEAENDQKPPRPPMPGEVSLADVGDELKRHQHYEQRGRKNVRERQGTMLRKS